PRASCGRSSGDRPRRGGGSVLPDIGVRIAVDAVVLDGDLALPPDPHGLVIFAHGSGSGRKSPRNREVAATLQGDGVATLLLDLLTLDEEAVDRHTAHLRFDIEFLAERLVAVTDWAN